MFELTEIVEATNAKLIRRSNFNYFKGVSTDSRTIKSGEIFLALVGNKFDGHNFVGEAIKRGAKAIIISKQAKDIKQQTNILKVNNTTIALGELAKYHRKKYNILLISITGSTGKTTTKDIIFHILSTKYKVIKNFGTHNNQIGVPQTIFNINVVEQPGDRNICVRLRKVNQSLFEELCRPIKVDTNYEKEVNAEPEIIKKSEDDKIIEERVEENEVITPSAASEKVINTYNNVNASGEKIILNRKKSNQEEKIYITKQEKIRTYLVYGFSVFCLIIIILLAMRKL